MNAAVVLVGVLRRRARHGQGGYALMSVLVVWTVTFLVVAALLALAFTTFGVTMDADRAARELRALDGAIDAAVNQMRFDPASTGNDACGLEPPVQRVEQMTFEQDRGPDIVVDVECEGSVSSSIESAADQLRLVSNQGYGGDLPWDTDCAAGDPGPGCWPWTEATGGMPGGMKPNLVHTGPSPLRLDSGVTVRHGAAALRNPVGGSDPAVVVAGEYTQGAMGPGGTAGAPCGQLDADSPTSAARIDDLDGEPTCDSEAARDVDANPTDAVAGFGVHPNTNPFIPSACPRAVLDIRPGRYDQAKTNALNAYLTGATSCANRPTFHFHPGVYYFDADELVFDHPQAYFVMGRPLGWTPYLVDATDSEGTQVRHPSVEGKGNTEANGIVGVRNSTVQNDPQAELCDTEQSGVTFVLSPRTAIRHRSGRLAMCPAFSPVAGQPPLPAIYQETSVPTGIEVTHAPLTRTLNCDYANQGNRDLVEPVALPARYSASRFEIPSLPGGQCRNGRTIRVDLDARNPAPITSARVLITGYENKSTPSNLITNRFTMISVFNSQNRRVCTTTAQPGLANGEWANTVDLLTGSCTNPRTTGPLGGADAGKTPDPRYPDAFQPTTSSHFRKEEPLTHESQLDGGYLEITQFATFLFPIPPLAQQMTIEDVQVVTNSTFGVVAGDVRSDPISGPGGIVGRWQDLDQVVDLPGHAVPEMPSGCEYHLVCHVSVPQGTRPTQPFAYELRMEDLDIDVPDGFLEHEIDPNIHGLRVLVRMDPMHCPANPDGSDECEFPVLNEWLEDSYFGKETVFRIEVETESGKRCMQTAGFVNAAQELAFDLLDVNVAVDPAQCAAVLTTYGDLQGADLTFRVEMPCLRNWPANIPWQCISTGWGDDFKVFQLRPPALQHVRLELETDSYVGPRPRSEVHVDATTVAAGSSFNVHGRVWMPRANLDVHWDGEVTEGRPLVTDELVLGSLGSAVHAMPARAAPSEDRHVVCCEPRRPDSRDVRIVARTGDRELRAEVHFADVIPHPDGGPSTYSPGHRVTIVDWQTCDGGRCDSG